MSSEPGDIVLDSFAGSGSTGAVAHKMKRRWIMIEMGEQCETHIIPRLKSVIDGTDINGISKKLNWQGGGGFDYFNLSESLLKKDNFDNLILNKKIDENLIIQAICKIEGYTFLEHREAWWKHGRSTENDFIHVTNKTLTQDDLNKLAKAVGEDSSLLVYCGAFKVEENFKNENLKNLTLKKITSSLFDKFDWDKNDYNLNVEENNAGINSE
jgi:adenine-specific DNA-methyltransferase